MCAYHFSEWCSGAQMQSKPTCSANTAASTQSRRRRCSRAGEGSASCAPNPIAKSMVSSVPEDQCAATAAHHCVLDVRYLVGGGAPHLPDGFEHEVHPVDVRLAEQAAVGVDREQAAELDVAVDDVVRASPTPQNPNASSWRNTSGLKFS